MLSAIVSRVVILVFGTLYPAYASYKSVRSKNIREYVKWMMYWIVFALFTTAETFTDVFLGFWFPFYYEVKVILVFWLLSPMTNGSSFLYRKFVHPMLSKREQDIDEYIARAKDQGYSTVLSLGTKGVNYATAVIMQTAIKGGGGLVNQLRRSYSLSDISMGMDEMNRGQSRTNADQDRTDAAENRTSRQRAYSSRQGVDMYFPEVDVDVRQRVPRESSVPLSQIRSTEDVSSGYSSAEPLYARAPTEDPRESLVRTSSVGSARVTRTRTTRAAASPGAKTRAAPTEDSISFEECEESDLDDLDEEFFEVTTALSPSISTKPITYTVTMHQATIATPAEVGKSVSAEQSLSPMLKTFSDSLLEMYLDNIGDNGDDRGMESVEKGMKINDDVVPIIEKNFPNIVEIIMPERKEDEASNVPVAKTVEKTDDAVIEIVAQNIKPEEQKEIEIKSIDNESKTEELGKVIEIKAIDNKSKTEELGKVIEVKAFDNESKTEELGKVIEVKAIDNESKTEELCKVSIPITEENIQEPKPTLVDTEPDNFEDADFFDTASISPSIEASAESAQTVTNAKLDRAGKYNKRPAPVPPRKIDGDSLSPDGDDVSFKSFDSRGSPSPRREITPSDRSTSGLEIQKKIDVNESDTPKLVAPTVTSPKASAQTPNVTSGAKPKAESPPSPNPQKKSKESPMSRLLSKFFSHEGASRGLVATSLTNLTDEIEAELRSASSLTFLGPDKPPKLPPKPPRKDAKNEVTDASPSGFRIRDMSHSPPRRKSDI